jgi:SAM-dependent methyltransferase
VLELGCGSGRLLCALAEPRRALWGLDLDESLLKMSRTSVRALPGERRRGVELVRGDMRAFDVGRRFERVLLPYNALYCLLSLADVRRSFRAVRRALEPGGCFAFDVWNADGVSMDALRAPPEDEPVARVQHEGRAWSVFEQCRLRGSRGGLDVTYTYFPRGGGAARKQTLAQRFYRSEQLLSLLDDAGFEVTSQKGGFDGSRFGRRSPRLVVCAAVREGERVLRSAR